MVLTFFLCAVVFFLLGCEVGALINSRKHERINDRLAQVNIRFAHVSHEIRQILEILENQKAPASSDQR